MMHQEIRVYHECIKCQQVFVALFELGFPAAYITVCPRCHELQIVRVNLLIAKTVDKPEEEVPQSKTPQSY